MPIEHTKQSLRCGLKGSACCWSHRARPLWVWALEITWMLVLVRSRCCNLHSCLGMAGSQSQEDQTEPVHATERGFMVMFHRPSLLPERTQAFRARAFALLASLCRSPQPRVLRIGCTKSGECSHLCETSKHNESAGNLPCDFHTTICHCHHHKHRKLMAEQHLLMANNGAPRLAFCPAAIWSEMRSSGLAHRLLEKCCERLHPLQPSTCLRQSPYVTSRHITR